jgi:CrcB protein
MRTDVEYLVIGIGGFFGANARYLVTGWVTQQLGLTFPYGTFLVNASGCFFLGLVMAFLRQQPSTHPLFLLFFATGFLGAYTTFSTFSYESLQLLQDGHLLLALENIFGSIVVGLLGAVLGFVLGGLL